MKLEAFPNTPREATLVRQEKEYVAAGLPAEVTIHLPFSTNVKELFNVELLEAVGISPIGLARQLDNTLKTNLGNLWNAKVTKALEKGKDLPTPDQFLSLEAAYSFLGVRAPSAEDTMSEEERVIRAELRKIFRSYVYGGAFENIGYTSIQTKPEAEKEVLPEGKLPLEAFEDIISAAYEGEDVSLLETDEGEAVLAFSEKPKWAKEKDEAGNRIPENFSAVAVLAKDIAKAELAKAKGVVAGPRVVLK